MKDKKMKTGQRVTGGFDLDQFVGASDTSETPPEGTQPPSKAKKRSVATKPTSLPKNTPAVISKPKKEMLTERVQFKLTLAEMGTLKEKAGLVTISAFLRNFLKENNLI